MGRKCNGQGVTILRIYGKERLILRRITKIRLRLQEIIWPLDMPKRKMLLTRINGFLTTRLLAQLKAKEQRCEDAFVGKRKLKVLLVLKGPKTTE